MPSWSGGCSRLPAPPGGAPRLGTARGAEAALRDAGSVVAGISRGASGRLWLQPVLRSLRGWRRRVSPTMRQTHAAGEKLFVDFAGDTIAVIDPLPATHDRRTSLLPRSAPPTSLTRRHAGAKGWPTGSARISMCSRYRRGAEGAGLRQSQGRRYQAVALRARHQSHLRRTSPPTTALRFCRRGSESRVTRRRWRSRCRSFSASCWHGCATSVSSRSRNSTSRFASAVADLNAKIMRNLGNSRRELLERSIVRAQATAGRAVSLCRVEARPCRPRLPHRDRRPLVLGALSAYPRTRRNPHHRYDGRDFPSRHPRRQPRFFGRAQPAHDDRRTHAERASALRRVDAGSRPARGRNWARYARAFRGGHAGEASPRTRLSLLPRHPPAGQGIRRRARSRLPARHSLIKLAPSPRSSRTGSTEPSSRDVPDGAPIKHGNIRGRGYFH